MVLGLNIGDYNGPYQRVLQIQQEMTTSDSGTVAKAAAANESINELFEELKPMQGRSSLHKMVSIFAAIITVLVNCIAVTYFIGTSRWCKEVAAAYELDEKFVKRSVSIKRRSFPWSFLGIMTTLGIIALGAASDPATLRSNTAEWVQPHMWAAFCGIALIAASFVIQMLKINDHSAVVEEMLAKVREIRLERGLEVE